MIPIYIFPTLTTYELYDHMPFSDNVTDGSYILVHSVNSWYIKKYDSYMPITLGEVPKEIRTILMLLGE